MGSTLRGANRYLASRYLVRACLLPFASRPARMFFKHADTKLLVASLVLFLLVTGAAAWGLGAVAGLYVALTLALGLVVGVQLNLYRKRQRDDELNRRHLQALLALHATLDLRAPLPPLTGWAASPELVATLVDLVRRHRPRTILELGSGASTVAMAYALEQHAEGAGHVHSLDHEADYGAATRAEAVRHGLDDLATVHHAPLRQATFDGQTFAWYDLDALPHDLPPLDLVVVDGPPRETNPQARYPALPALLDRLSDRALVVLDDADRADEAALLDRWLARYDGFAVERYPSPKGTAVLRRTA